MQKTKILVADVASIFDAIRLKNTSVPDGSRFLRAELVKNGFTWELHMTFESKEMSRVIESRVVDRE